MSKKIKVEGVMSLNQAVSYLEDVITSLKEGSIRVEAGEEAMTLTPQDLVDFEMGLAQKKGKEKFELEISWKNSGQLDKKNFNIS